MPADSKYITVLSTYTDDRLIDKTGRLIGEVVGGPAFFIESALKAKAVPYSLVHGPRLQTEIMVGPDGEWGKVPKLPDKQPVASKSFTDWTIVSTLLDEWDLTDLPPRPYLFIDIQGFVRNGSDFGKKKIWDVPVQIQKGVFCLKGTAEEVSYLPAKTTDDQKNRLLIITKGGEGADIYYRGQHYEVRSSKLTNLSNTVGAGDTFLGCFVAEMYLGTPVFKAAEEAARYATEFLKKNISDKFA